MANKTSDPAVLFFVSDWIASTAAMSADCRGWYINLLCHNHDKGELPDDIEQLGNLANVRFSDFERFKEGFASELSKKFVKRAQVVSRTLNWKASCLQEIHSRRNGPRPERLE